MTIKDKIYDSISVKEAVLVELLNSPGVLRLKKISQFGVPDKYYHFKNYSRYEHSVGVMILLRKFGATIEEQIAGLLHDVSVLTFSHVADWVFANGSEGIEDYHDSIHKEFVKNTEIPGILEKHNFVLDRILDENNFTLLERNTPELCADRIDYALREFKYWLNPNIVKSCIKGLTNHNGKIVFLDKNNALEFATNYLELQLQHWAGVEGIIRYYLFSETLKIALEKKILSQKDFHKDEPFILSKIEKNQNKEIKEMLKILKQKDLKELKKSLGKKIRKKFRYVDPKVMSNGQPLKLSEINPKFQNMLNKRRETNKEGITI